MKYFLLAIAFLLVVPFTSQGQSKALNKFYRTYKKGSDAQNMKVPGWLIRFGGKIAVKSSDMEKSEEEMARELIKKAGTVRFIYTEEGATVPEKAVKKLRQDLKGENFDDLIMIRSGEMDFQLMIREQDGIVKNLLMFYNDREEGEMAFISMKLKLGLDDLTKLVEKGMEEKYHEFIEPKEEVPVVEPVL